MATTKVTIWNMAVGIMGGNADGLILSADETGSVADHCREFWEEAVDTSLIYMQPIEATAYVDISESSDTPEAADWEYVYDLPADFLAMVHYTDETDRSVRYEYEIVGDYIYSNEDSCYIKYIQKMDYDTVSDMSIQLRRLCAANLAVMIAPFFKPQMLNAAYANLERTKIMALEENNDHIYEDTTESAYGIESSADIT